MKKILALTLAFMATTMIFVGCSSDDTTQTNTQNNTASTQNDDKNTQIDDTENTDVLKVGIDLKYYPFMYLDENSNPEGFEVDIAYAFGEFLGREVEIVNTDFSMLIPALDTKNVDIIISDMSSNAERDEKADFSIPYRYTKTLSLVNKDFATENNITNDMSEEDFFAIEGMRFVGLAGTMAVTVPQSFGCDVTEYPEIATALLEITKGNADAIVGASTIYGDNVAYPDTTIVYEGISNVMGSCFVVAEGDEKMQQLANEFIESMYASGGFYELCGDKYDEKIGEFLQNQELGLDYIIYTNSEEK